MKQHTKCYLVRTIGLNVTKPFDLFFESLHLFFNVHGFRFLSQLRHLNFASLGSGMLMRLEQPKKKKRNSSCYLRKSFNLGHNNFLSITNGNNGKAFFPSLYTSNKVPKSSTCSTAETAAMEMGVGEIKDKCKKWLWRGQFSINYFVSADDSPPDDQRSSNSNPPLLLVHGFGASIPHWRRNIRTLSQNNRVYAIDLLGFGASDKPAGFAYTMETWAQLILDFLDEVVRKPTVLVGNSVGSLACAIAASESSQSLVRGLVLLNCAGGMNNKAIVDDWRIKLLLPLLWLVDFLLKQQGIASFIFERVKQRDNIRNVLLSVYGNKESVDEELVEIIIEPTFDQGALDAFISIVTGPPGPNPVKLMPKLSIPVLVLWGNEDPFTPLDGPVGRYFSSLPSKLPNISLFVLEGVGHCPHDDRPELVHEKLLPWLAHLPAS